MKINIEKELPTFVEAVKQKPDTIRILHTSFDDAKYEHELLGAAIKYATKNGVSVLVISENYSDQEAVKEDQQKHQELVDEFKKSGVKEYISYTI